MAYNPDPPPQGVSVAYLARELRRIADELARMERILASLAARIAALENE